MPRFDATINGKSLASYGITPTTATVPQPEAKTYQADIPGRDGMLDYTDAFGVIRYDNRTVTVEAYEIGDIAARMEHRRAICSDMHGKSCMLSLSTLDGYTFSGRCNVEYDEDGSQTVYTLSFDCEPYKLKETCTYRVNAAGGVTINLACGRKRVCPTIEVNHRALVSMDGRTWVLEPGASRIRDLWISGDPNIVTIDTHPEYCVTYWTDYTGKTWDDLAGKRWSEVGAGSQPLQEGSPWTDYTGKTWADLAGKRWVELMHTATPGDEYAAYIQFDWSDL